MKNLKQTLAIGVCCALAFTSIGCSLPNTIMQTDGKVSKTHIKNVILLISDGTSSAVPTLSRWKAAYDPSTQKFDTNYRLSVDNLTK